MLMLTLDKNPIREGWKLLKTLSDREDSKMDGEGISGKKFERVWVAVLISPCRRTLRSYCPRPHTPLGSLVTIESKTGEFNHSQRVFLPEHPLLNIMN
jgi:hypothetical protein